ncbi:Imm52 family immunity protein [Caballeronia sordidicola]|nr:Imm52 family immunity protein [Caballeronia sordidicola]
MNITLTFRLRQDSLPSESEQLEDLWKVATLLEPLGFPLEKWYPPADTPGRSKLNSAFEKSGPTPTTIAIFHSEKQEIETPWVRVSGVWNGSEDDGAVTFSTSLSAGTAASICSFRLRSKGVAALSATGTAVPFIIGLLKIWPAATVEVGPYRYFSMLQVFPNRPGAGWMLYLPRVISTKEVPEARDLIPVMEGKKQKGTLVVSVIDEVFSADNPEHVMIANAIEERLVDQDLLPRYAEL